jgi:zinc protease
MLVLGTTAYADGSTPQLATLDDGVRIICRNEPSSKLVAITVLVQAGSEQENLTDAGIGSMVADALLMGTTNQDSDAIAESIGDIGGNVKAIWEPDVTQIRALVLPNEVTDAIYLICDVLKNANFTDTSVENSRQDMLSRIQERSDDVFEATNDRLRESLYDGTPFALPQIGTSSTIKRLTSADLITYFRRYYRPDNITISVVGYIDPSAVVSTFAGNMSDFVRPRSHHTPPLVIPEPSNSSDPIIVKSYRRDVTAGLMMAGYLAPGVDSMDYPAMLVANALLGGMKTSLMFKNLREKKLYGYEVASTYTTQIGLSDITGYILYPVSAVGADGKTHVDQTPLVKAALLDQFRTMTQVLPTDEELERAKKFVIGSYLLAHERIEDRSYYLGYSELAMTQDGGWKFDDSYAQAINAVTESDVLHVSKKYFSGAPVISLLLPGDPNAGVVND